MDVSSLTQ
ncbi:unnamed protein product, partial [Didymodactylos carnosus]